MAKATITRLVYYTTVERAIASDPGMRNVMQRVSDDIADDARPNAPRSEGQGHSRGRHGADTIAGQVIETARGWEGRVGWPRPSYYLYMHEKGWVHKSARPFLRPAAERRRKIT